MRVRYAATTAEGAARERYRDTGSFVPADHADHYVITLSGSLRVLDLRREWVLDALGLDDRISTSREPQAWDCAQQLTDVALRWWGTAIHGIVYRPRTTPESAANIAFFGHAPLSGRSRQLRQARNLLDALIVGQDFTVDF